MAHLFQAIYIYITLIFYYVENQSQGNPNLLGLSSPHFWGFLLYQTYLVFSTLMTVDMTHGHSEKEMNIWL